MAALLRALVHERGTPLLASDIAANVTGDRRHSSSITCKPFNYCQSSWAMGGRTA